MRTDRGRLRPPAELRAWNWLSIGLLALFLVVGAITTSRVAAAVILAVGGVVQVVFGTMAAVNRANLADRLARYYTQRPLMLGGFIVNRYRLSWQLQGLGMALAGVALLVVAGFLIASR